MNERHSIGAGRAGGGLLPAWLALGAGTALTAAFLVRQPVRVLDMAPNRLLILWQDHALWTVLAALALPLAALAWILARRAGVGSRLAHALTPLALLPLLVAVLYWTGRIPEAVTGTLIFALPVVVSALIVHRALAPVLTRRVGPRAWTTWTWAVLVLGSAGYAWLGWHYSSTIGAHSGDEGHYIIQAESLHGDGDLDIRNDMDRWAGPDPLSRFTKSYLHVSTRSRGNHWYSVHPFGLSMLLAPAMGWGYAGQHLVLGLIAGIGLGGMLRLCLLVGAPLGASVATVLLFGLSQYWCAYAARAYPEALGASLLTWACWGVLAQGRRPWSAALVAAACCCYLPWAHTRFIPSSLMAIGLFGLWGLATPVAWRPKLIRLSAFTALCVAGYALYVIVYRRMYEGGGTYSMDEFLLSYPRGAWYALSDGCGIVSVLPLALWLLAAHAYALVRVPAARWTAAAFLGLFAATAVTCCANQSFTGGSAVSGRYVLVAAPLLLPVPALVLARANSAARAWFLLLGLVSVAYTLIVTPSLLDIPFNHPATQLSEYLPRFRGLIDPYAFHFAGQSSAEAARLSDLAVALSFAATFVIVAIGHRRLIAGACLLLICGAAVCAHVALDGERERRVATPSEIADTLAMIELDRTTFHDRMRSPEPAPLLNVSNRFPPGVGTNRFASITTDDLGARAVATLISQPRLERNDWSGRPFAWSTLVQTFGTGRGCRLLRVTGRREGVASLILAVREGERTLYEGAVPFSPSGRADQSLVVRCRGGKREVALLARLEGGDGVFRTESIGWTPVSRTLVEQAGLALPERTRWIDEEESPGRAEHRETGK